MKWADIIERVRFLNMFWVQHFSCSAINTVYVHELLMLVHDGCLWLGGPISITHMLVHRITLLPFEGMNLVDDFVGKSQEKKLEDQMKSDFRLVKKLRGYGISSISDDAVKSVAQILAGKIMRKCHADELSGLVVFLAAVQQRI